MTASNSDITILIPAYRPGNNMITLLESLANEGFSVLVVNDGTDDKYNHIFEKAKDFATVIGYANNKGKGFALKYGFEHIGSIDKKPFGVVTADSDGQHSVADICKVANLLIENNSIVIGERDLTDAPLRSKIGNVMSQVVYTIVTGKYLSDNQAGLRGFPIRYLDRLIKTMGNRYEYEMNVVTNAAKRNRKIVETGIETIYIENNKESNFRPLRDTLLIQAGLWMRGLPSAIAYLAYLIVLSHVPTVSSAANAQKLSMLLGCIIAAHAIGTFLAWRHGGAHDRWHTAGSMTGIFIKYFAITSIYLLLFSATESIAPGIFICALFIPLFSYFGGRLLDYLKKKLH